MGAHNHGNVSSGESFASHKGSTILQKTHNFTGNPFGSKSASILNRPYPALFIPRVHEPELHRLLLAVVQLPVTRKRMVENFIVEKGSPCVIEQGIEGIKQRRRRAPVISQGKTTLFTHLSGRPHVGEDIGATEAVDRLFRVADKKERQIRASVDGSENLILHRISILKLVNQRRPVLYPEQSRKYCSPAVGEERTIEIFEQVVEKADIAGTLAERQALPVKANQLSLES